jgi:geranylgeranyl pyrophosphate synthase
MNDAVLADLQESPLQRLLGHHFSEAALRQLLGQNAALLGGRVWERALLGPVADFLERPGKAFRGGLVSSSFALAGGSGPCPERLCAVVEILHAGSLIIDDIEDESISRRGGPALHRVHGLSVALNAGNWMYFWALGLLDELGLCSEAQLTLYRWAHRALLRCHHGQALDLSANVVDMAQEQLPALVLATAELKTGALIELSTVLGAVAAGARPELVDALASFGRNMGVALQMLDDVGGLVSEARSHKGHEDLILGRPTWPWAWLAGELPVERFAELVRLSQRVQAEEAPPETLARVLRERLGGSGRVRVRRHVQQFFGELAAMSGPSAALDALRADLARLEKSYG